jgi:multimeric flavodoxin WrbA/putative sterol carrier protein
MSDHSTIVAVNGSPHAGIGNTSMMLEMLRSPLKEEGFQLDTINLADHEIDYCYGCAFCLEKGKCWIDDDHRSITQKLLTADGVILASPVYVLGVTAQMKAFLDRSLPYGHKPRSTWKPGLAVCVSAGMGETDVGNYLANLLRIYGAFSVGKFTAISVGPGEYIGAEAVATRAQDLARDLVRAIKEKRRHPASDLDLRFYQFMGDLVKHHKDRVMKHDYEHWHSLGLYEGFENYIQQTKAQINFDPGARKAWVKQLIADHKKKKQAESAGGPARQATNGPQAAGNCAELLEMMPLGFNSAEGENLEAVYQFEISGRENFTGHLKISGGRCSYHDGPADTPGVIIKSPADVWLAIAKGELNGQQAFMSGQYKVEGDLNLLMQLSQLFSQ